MSQPLTDADPAPAPVNVRSAANFVALRSDVSEEEQIKRRAFDALAKSKEPWSPLRWLSPEKGEAAPSPSAPDAPS